MPDPQHITAALAIAFAITFALRAVPFAALAAAVTAAAHLAFGRRTLVSVGLGALWFATPVNLL